MKKNKITKLTLCVLLMSMAVAMGARTPVELRINGVSIVCNSSNTVIPERMNESFLKGVYCGSINELEGKQVFISDVRYTDNYSIALLRVDGYFYSVTYKHEGGIIDGVLLLRKGDILIAKDDPDHPQIHMREKEPAITVEKNAVTVTRNFVSVVDTGRGGPSITEEGCITTKYAVDQLGKFSRDKDSSHSKWTERENMSIPGRKFDNPNGREKVSESNNCRTISNGWNVIKFFTSPASDESVIGHLEAILNSSWCNASKKNDKVSQRLDELWQWQKGMIYRNPGLWLSWFTNYYDSRALALFKDKLNSDESFANWLKTQVKNHRYKKERKAWEKLIE